MCLRELFLAWAKRSQKRGVLEGDGMRLDGQKVVGGHGGVKLTNLEKWGEWQR